MGLIILLICAMPTLGARAIVTHRVSGCDYFVIRDANDDYALLEWYGGHDPDKGDALIGSFKQYGMTEIFCATHDEDVEVYIEEYDMSRQEAIKGLYEQCE